MSIRYFKGAEQVKFSKLFNEPSNTEIFYEAVNDIYFVFMKYIKELEQWRIKFYTKTEEETLYFDSPTEAMQLFLKKEINIRRYKE